MVLRFGRISTGSHTLTLRASINGNEQQTSQRINMIADSVIDLNIHLPESP